MTLRQTVRTDDFIGRKNTYLLELFIAFFAIGMAIAPAAFGQAPAANEVAMAEGPLPVRHTLPVVPELLGTPLDSALSEPEEESAWRRLVTGVHDAGFTVGFSTDVDGTRAFGGQVTERSALRSLQRVNLTVDLQALLGIPGATIFGEAHSWMGHNGSDDVGDVHGYSNIDAEEFRDVAELWYEQRLLGDALRLKGGYVDANSEFIYVENGGGFINSAMGFSPSMFVLPTYPEATLGLVAFAYPGHGSYVGAAVYDGSATATAESAGRELLTLGEVGRSWSLGALPGRLGLGAWHHSGSFARLGEDGVDTSARGWWAVADQTLWSAGEESSRQLAGYLQLGVADGRVSEVTRHLGGGLAWTGALPTRGEDVLGFGVSRIELTPAESLGYDARGETVGELYYELHLPFGVTLRPDVQYLHDLGGVSDSRDLVVATLRASFER